MPIIHVEMFSGRDDETRKELVSALTKTYVEVCGGNPDGVHVILQDVDKDRWAKGGKLFSDLLPD